MATMSISRAQRAASRKRANEASFANRVPSYPVAIGMISIVYPGLLIRLHGVRFCKSFLIDLHPDGR